MERIVAPSSVGGTVEPPCSKSYAQRAIAAALLAEGTTTIRNIEWCDDTRSAMKTAVALGARIAPEPPSTLHVTGGLAPRSRTISIGESGLAARLFTPIAALSPHAVTVTGRGSMTRRPVGMMIDPLRALGVEVESDGFLPFTVRGPLRGGRAEVDSEVSSQFLTGLLIALPLTEADSTLHVMQLNSAPYIAMTLDTVARFGGRVEHNDLKEFYIPGGQRYIPTDLTIEGDWSGAAFMLAAGALAGEVTVVRLDPLSLQADTAMLDALTRAGAEVITSPGRVTVRRRNLNAFEFDAAQCPDLFPVLTALATGCEGTTVLHGIGRLFHKESNRAEALYSEFTRMGISVELDPATDTMRIRGGRPRGTVVDSHADHRIAMAAAVAGLVGEGPMRIRGAESVTKSYPRFWDDLARLQSIGK